MSQNIRIVQLKHDEQGRRIALVDEPSLVLLNKFSSVYDLALNAIGLGTDLNSLIRQNLSDIELEYDAVYAGMGDWRLLPSFDVPSNAFACMVSGTGLTHKNSALNRQMMHKSAGDQLTDSMKMYSWGLEGGRPDKGSVGVQPEWFYKGTGSILKAHGEALSVPSYANDGGEEPEIAGVYIVGPNGMPYRIGFTTGNEFSDHIMEKKNYLYLAPSKLRSCAIGPELVIDADFSHINGVVEVHRDEEKLWSSEIQTGETNMAHSLLNLEYHHFKYADHRQPMQGHVHFFGADAFSFGAGIRLHTGDVMRVQWQGMGRALMNPIEVDDNEEKVIEVQRISGNPR